MTRLTLARPAMTRLTLARRAVARRTVANLTLAGRTMHASYGPRPLAACGCLRDPGQARSVGAARRAACSRLGLPRARVGHQLAPRAGLRRECATPNPNPSPNPNPIPNPNPNPNPNQVLFPRWGARRLARWYWLKVTADGQLAGGSPRSPHRKPWEPLLVGFIGSGAPPPLPPRRVICSVPLGHSHKPPLCTLLRPLALPLSACAEATVGAPAGATELEQQQAWRTLPKLELFARELRPGWHSAGNEVLRFQHESFWEAR